MAKKSIPKLSATAFAIYLCLEEYVAISRTEPAIPDLC